MDHHALSIGILGYQLPDDLLPGPLGAIRQGGVQVQHVVLSAGLVVHPHHVSGQDAQVEIVPPGELPQDLPVLVAPGLLVGLPEVRPELIPGSRDERDAVAFDHVEEHLPLLPPGVVLLIVIPIAEYEGHLYVQGATLLLVHYGFQQIAGARPPSCGEPSKSEHRVPLWDDIIKRDSRPVRHRKGRSRRGSSGRSPSCDR